MATASKTLEEGPYVVVYAVFRGINIKHNKLQEMNYFSIRPNFKRDDMFIDGACSKRIWIKFTTIDSSRSLHRFEKLVLCKLI